MLEQADLVAEFRGLLVLLLRDALLERLAQALNRVLHLERAARAVWNLAAMDARPVDAAQERLELAAERRVADTAANLARLLEVAVAHAAVRADELRRRPALRFRLLRRRAEDTLEEVIHRYISLSLVLHEEFAVLRRALLTEVLLDLAVRPDLCNMDDRAVAAAILT